ncbi:PREDICTED: uncharacterized protein LOC109479945 isoform X1 [Branchiostoma belcheri]|uniref:Uncharacterized protein LOC109479945 isoform X1 n=1 Tax=Branchiostoma belcheri TaxID=7741 RepID=A0A6P5A721_BRABE|nr:PREDICTED: uncharacterized protein LOC109479945 isoform X1 [Branchiostoma belcheri]
MAMLRCLKCSLVVVTLPPLLAVGVIIAGIGAWATARQPTFFVLGEDNRLSPVPCFGVFLFGAAVVILVFVGCCGVISGSRSMLRVYTACVAALLMALSVMAILSNRKLYIYCHDIPWPAFSSAVLIVTFFLNYLENKKKETRRNKLNHVNEQLSKMYGPISGYRLANRKSYLKAIGGYKNLREYLSVAESKWRDPKSRDEGTKMLKSWRRVLFHVTHPQDLKTEETIRHNAHLFEYGVKEAELFQNFIFHVNYEKLIVANWQERGDGFGINEPFGEEDFARENNAGISDDTTTKMLADMVTHVKETYDTLVVRKQKLMREMDEASDGDYE